MRGNGGAASAAAYESPVAWTDVLQALAVLGGLEDQVADICARIHAAVVVPLLRTAGATLTVRAMSKTSQALVLTFPRASVVSGGGSPGARRTNLDGAALGASRRARVGWMGTGA
jgi:hypothetical protein